MKKMKNKIIFIAVAIGIIIIGIVLYFLLFNKKEPEVSVETYSVTFNSNGGSEVEKIEIECGKTLKLPTNPTSDGYIFDGWIDR